MAVVPCDETGVLVTLAAAYWPARPLVVDGVAGALRLAAPTRSIGGTVVMGGAGVPGRTVRLHDRATGAVVAVTSSGAGGAYSVAGPLTGAYYAVVLPAAGDGSNAAVADQLTGV